MNAKPVCSEYSNRVHWTTDDIQRKVEQNTVVVFAKGTPDNPRCGLSEEVMAAVAASGHPYEVVDVSQERSILPALKAYAGEKRLPLVYVCGTLVSSWDEQSAMLRSGALQERIELAFSSPLAKAV
ncbi:MAG: hypothetical protein KDD69_02425 [Bdellovibrionales bacterium]|nr:hypothetical protein [Bdellovibrionales bacterium]